MDATYVLRRCERSEHAEARGSGRPAAERAREDRARCDSLSGRPTAARLGERTGMDARPRWAGLDIKQSTRARCERTTLSLLRCNGIVVAMVWSRPESFRCGERCVVRNDRVRDAESVCEAIPVGGVNGVAGFFSLGLYGCTDSLQYLSCGHVHGLVLPVPETSVLLPDAEPVVLNRRFRFLDRREQRRRCPFVDA